MSAVVETRAGFGARLGKLVGLGLVAAVAAAVVATLAAALLKALGADFEVDGGTIPVAGFGSITFMFSVLGVVLAAALLRWSPRPAEQFLRVAVVLTALSLVPPVLWGHGAGTVLALVVLHLVAAAGVVSATVRILRHLA